MRNRITRKSDNKKYVDTIDFFLVGVGKAGTSSIYYYLDQHPDIALPNPKEPNFFSTDEYYGGITYFAEKYLREYKSESIIGDTAPQNFFAPNVPERIFQTNPSAKILIILRDPVARAYSDWWMWHCMGKEKLGFKEAIWENYRKLEECGSLLGPHGQRIWSDYIEGLYRQTQNQRFYLEQGWYGTHIKRFNSYFGRHQIKIVFFEDIKYQPRNTMSSIFSFLNVDDRSYVVDLQPQWTSYNSRLVASMANMANRYMFSESMKSSRAKKVIGKYIKKIGNKPSIEPEMRSFLANYFSSEVLKVEELTGRDCRAWKSSW